MLASNPSDRPDMTVSAWAGERRVVLVEVNGWARVFVRVRVHGPDGFSGAFELVWIHVFASS